MKFQSSISFPDKPFLHAVDDIVAVGGKLDVGTLYHAYLRGIFPWPQPNTPLLWFFPQERGVLDFKDLHVSKSLKKLIKKNELSKKENLQLEQFHFSVDLAFSEVIDSCQLQKRKNQSGTWILPEIKKAYIDFHKAGYSHSVECWKGNQLVGGIYGVLVNQVFSGESMFNLIPNAGKLSLMYLIEWLKHQGITWMDIQMVTPILKSFGGKYISGETYYKRLNR